MKRWLVFVALGMLTLFIVAYAALYIDQRRLPTEPPTEDRLSDADRARLLEAIHLRNALGNEVWPGWGDAAIPLIVYNDAYAFLVGADDPAPGWVTVPGGDRRGGAWEPVADDALPGGLYHRSALPPGVTPQAFTVRIGDAWAGSIGTKPWLEFELVRTLRSELPGFLRPVFPYRLFMSQLFKGSDGHVAGMLHESFHAYQGITAAERLVAGERAIAAGERNYPWDDETMRSAWQAELDLLAGALRAETDEEALRLARDFLTQRDQRRQQLSPALIDYERRREWTEGLAKHVELSIWRAADDAPTYEPVAAIAGDRDFHGYDAAGQKWNQEIDQMQRMAGDHGEGRFYYSGMAQAALLERLAPAWTSRVLMQEVFQEDLLREVVASATDPAPNGKPALAGRW